MDRCADTQMKCIILLLILREPLYPLMLTLIRVLIMAETSSTKLRLQLVHFIKAKKKNTVYLV